jgi:hypothetical protein
MVTLLLQLAGKTTSICQHRVGLNDAWDHLDVTFLIMAYNAR